MYFATLIDAFFNKLKSGLLFLKIGVGTHMIKKLLFFISSAELVIIFLLDK